MKAEQHTTRRAGGKTAAAAATATTSAEQYRALRKSLGTQEQAAALLEVSLPTIKRREKKGARIGKEAVLAMERLVAEAHAGIVHAGNS